MQPSRFQHRLTEETSFMMPIDCIPDWEKRIERVDAMWYGEIIDRPVVEVTFPKPNPDYPYPKAKSYSNLKDKWFDAEYRAEFELARVMNTEYLGDSLPNAWPNLGPEIFSAYFGCELEYGEDTAWAIPNLEDWSDIDHIRFSRENFCWKKTVELTEAFLEVGKGRFYTSFTDLHAGGDAIAAFRDPARLCIDMIEHPDEVKQMLDYVTDVYLDVVDFFHEKLIGAGQVFGTAGMPIMSARRWHCVSNDFSYMISKRMFDEVFLPGIRREAEHLEASIYHLDGEGALTHLDSLLQVPEINSIQWVYGANNGPSSRWIDVYKRIQQAGKGLYLWFGPDELDFFMENLGPQGLYIILENIESHEHAKATLKRISGWR
jgi:hypothetical protein